MGRKDDMGESSIGKQNIVLNPVTITAAAPKSEADYQQELKAYEENEKAIEAARQAQPGYQAPLAGIAIQEPLDMQGTQPSLASAVRPVDVPAPEAELAPQPATGNYVAAPASQQPATPEPSSAQTEPTQPVSVVKPVPMAKPKPPTKREQSFTHQEWQGIRTAFDSIPVQRIPKKARNEFQSLVKTATLLVETGLDVNAAADVKKQFVQKLKGYIVANEDEYRETKHDVEVAETVKITLDKLNETEDQEQEEARTDAEGLRKAARDADMHFTKEFANEYRRANFKELGRPECDLRLARSGAHAGHR